MAIIPGVTLSELWHTIGYAEDALRVVSLFVILIGLLGMLVSLYTALTERRREMAVLRAVGAGPWRIVLLLVLESGFLSMGGAIIGVLLVYVLSFLSQPIVERHFGLFIPIQPLTTTAYLYVLAVIVAGLLIGFVPALGPTVTPWLMAWRCACKGIPERRSSTQRGTRRRCSSPRHPLAGTPLDDTKFCRRIRWDHARQLKSGAGE